MAFKECFKKVVCQFEKIAYWVDAKIYATVVHEATPSR